MFNEDKKLKAYIPVLVFLATAIVTIFFYGKYQVLVNEQLYETLAGEYGVGFVTWVKSAVSETNPVFTTLSGCVSMFVSPFILALYHAAIIMLVCKLFFKSEIKFQKTYVMMLYIGCAEVIGSLLTIITSVLIGSASNVFALGSFMAPDNSSFLYNFLSSVTLFSIIQYVLMFIGVSSYAKLEGNKGKIAAAACIVIFVLLTVVSAALAGGGMASGVYDQLYDTYLNTL